MVSCLPHRGELDLKVYTATKLLVRIPEWAPKKEVKVYRARTNQVVVWDGSYVVLANTKPGDEITVTYPIRIAQVKETPSASLAGTLNSWSAGEETPLSISPSPGGKWIPMFERPELESETVPKN